MRFEEALKYAKETIKDVQTAVEDLEDAYKEDMIEERRNGYNEGYEKGLDVEAEESAE